MLKEIKFPFAVVAGDVSNCVEYEAEQSKKIQIAPS